MNGTIKVTDFGLAENLCISNYFRKDYSKCKDDERVPIRWMAPESITSGFFNEKTDVVSEILR